MQNKLGLLEQIKKARCVESVQFLIGEGESYKHAHPSTKRRWHAAAKKKLKDLSSN